MSASTDPSGRALQRFTDALDHPYRPTGLVHSLTPSQILSAIAPNLLKSLSSAREPPFGIPPSTTTRQPMGSGAGSASASAFAGKVYTSHEFRTREASNNTTGLSSGATGSSMDMSAGVGMGSGSGSGAGLGAGAGTGGLGVNALKASRPASRHVDEYAR